MKDEGALAGAPEVSPAKATHTKRNPPVVASNELAMLTRAEAMLARAATAPDIVTVIDLAEAAKVLARKAELGLSAQNRAASISARATLKLGRVLAQMEKAKGAATPLHRARAAVEKLADLGVNYSLSSRAQLLAGHCTEADIEVRAAQATQRSHEFTTAELLKEARERKREKANAEASAEMSGRARVMFDSDPMRRALYRKNVSKALKQHDELVSFDPKRVAEVFSESNDHVLWDAVGKASSEWWAAFFAARPHSLRLVKKRPAAKAEAGHLNRTIRQFIDSHGYAAFEVICLRISGDLDPKVPRTRGRDD